MSKFKTNQLSIEIFPPHNIEETRTILQYFKSHSDFSPSYIAITNGAGGSENNQPLEFAQTIQTELNIPVMMHITSLYQDYDSITTLIDQLHHYQISRLLVLRGDLNANLPTNVTFPHASDLIKYLKQHTDFELAGACYPEKHPEASTLTADINNLKIKIANGASQLVTQIIFDNQKYYHFTDQLEKLGVTTPVEVGIMPCTNLDQIDKITQLTKRPLPDNLIEQLQQVQDDSQKMFNVGINYAVAQIKDLLAHGVTKIHLYPMNIPDLIEQIRIKTASLFANN